MLHLLLKVRGALSIIELVWFVLLQHFWVEVGYFFRALVHGHIRMVHLLGVAKPCILVVLVRFVGHCHVLAPGDASHVVWIQEAALAGDGGTVLSFVVSIVVSHLISLVR